VKILKENTVRPVFHSFLQKPVGGFEANLVQQ